jgi:type IV pilus assembly protein PilO
MTETRKWTLAAVAAGLVLVLAGWFLLIAPKRAEVADIKADTDAQEQTNQQLETDISVLKQQHQDLPDKQAELAQLQTKIPTSAELTSYIQLLQTLAQKSQVSLTSLAPSEAAPLGGTADPTGALPLNTLAAMNLEVVVTGTYFQITDFMNQLETAPRYTLVTGYSFAEGDAVATGDAASTDTSTTNTGDPELTATISARIYEYPTAEAAAEAAGTDTTTTQTAP